MKALDKKQQAEKAKHSEVISIAAEKVEAAITAFNEALEAAQQPVTEAMEAYNAALEEARGFAEQMVADMQSAYGDKSEKWQESERGQAYQNWIDEWAGRAVR